MKTFFSTFTILFLFSLATVQAQNDGCPKDFHLVEKPPGSGNFVCEETTIVCPGGPRDYIDKGTGDSLCCPPSKNLVILDDKTRDGVCCDMSQTVQDGKCVTPPPTPAGGSGQCPQQPAGICALKAACGNGTSNGLKYGSCYSIVFPDGHQLGRGKGGVDNQYVADGYIQDIPFKVCKSTTDCGTGSVGNTDTFFMQDLVGDANDVTSKAGWMNNAAGGAHLAMTANPATAGKFKGTNSCSATNCKCLIRLSGDPSGLGYACPAQQPGITFWPNQRVTLNMQFTEVPCDSADAASALFQTQGNAK